MTSEKLKQLRKLKGISQRELAKRLNVSCSTIAMIESGKRDGSKEVIGKIAAFFGVSIDYLYGLEDMDLKIKKDKSSMIDKFLDDLIDEGIIRDPNSIDKDTEEMIINAVKAQIALKLKSKE